MVEVEMKTSKNASKNGAITLSLNERRLAWMMARLQQERKEVNTKNLRQLAYKAIDAYLGC